MTEHEIIKLLKSNADNNIAFRALLSLYKERVYWHVRKIVTSHEDADDVTQNVFIKIYRNIGKFNEESKLYTWIYRIATNESLTFLRKKKRHEVETWDENQHVEIQKKLVAENTISPSVIIKNLLHAISTLPDKQRLVFQMKYFDDMKYQEISEILGTSEGALKASFHHAQLKIKDVLRKQEIL